MEMIEGIIWLSSENDMILVHFTNSFWYYILYCFKEPNQENILKCKNTRMRFIKYYDLVTKIFKNKESKIKKDAISYYEKDEFAILLDQIIKKYLNNEKPLINIEKLSFITKYNPFIVQKILTFPIREISIYLVYLT